MGSWRRKRRFSSKSFLDDGGIDVARGAAERLEHLLDALDLVLGLSAVGFEGVAQRRLLRFARGLGQHLEDAPFAGQHDLQLGLEEIVHVVECHPDPPFSQREGLHRRAAGRGAPSEHGRRT